MNKQGATQKQALSPSRDDREQWRTGLAQYAAEHGVSAAARKFGTTRKTARLWMNRVEKDITAQTVESPVAENKPIETAKPKTSNAAKKSGARLKVIRRNGTITKERKAELLELNNDVAPVLPNRPADSKSSLKAKNKNRPTNIASGDAVTRLLIFDSLDLSELPQLKKFVASGKLPGWQLTALEASSGAAWVSFCYEMNAKTAATFLRNLAFHLKQNGIDINRIYTAVNPDSELGRLANLPGGEDFTFPAHQSFAGFHNGNLALFNPRFTSADFQNRQVKEFYCEPLPGNPRKFLDSAYAYILRSGYERKPGKSGMLPPFQTLCRMENGYCREDVLNFRPRILDFYQRQKATSKGRIRGIFGAMASLMKTAFVRPKGESPQTAEPSEKEPSQPILIPTAKADKSNEINAEFMNLRNIDWKNAPSRPIETSRPDRRRNRQEIIERARAMLAARAGDAELKSALAITDGELALIKQRMGVSR